MSIRVLRVCLLVLALSTEVAAERNYVVSTTTDFVGGLGAGSFAQRDCVGEVPVPDAVQLDEVARPGAR